MAGYPTIRALAFSLPPPPADTSATQHNSVPLRSLQSAGKVFLLLLQGEVRERAIAELKLSESQLASLHGYRGLPRQRAPEGVWKAAPRDGVWATAPFLHNGSVPNLYEMLIPAAERTKKFWLGGDFDPVKVGRVTTATWWLTITGLRKLS